MDMGRQHRPSSPRESKTLKQNDTDFHCSEAGDIYDLYNACNGVFHDGRLDVRKLDELSEEELEVFNVSRLREIWVHTTTGCLNCQSIINILNHARGMLKGKQEEVSSDQVTVKVPSNILRKRSSVV